MPEYHVYTPSLALKERISPQEALDKFKKDGWIV